MTTTPTSPGTGHRTDEAGRTARAPRQEGPRRGPGVRRGRSVQPELPLVAEPAMPPGGGAAVSPAAGDQVTTAPDWRLDEETRRAGRVGIAAARAILAQADRAA